MSEETKADWKAATEGLAATAQELAAMTEELARQKAEQIIHRREFIMATLLSNSGMSSTWADPEMRKDAFMLIKSAREVADAIMEAAR